MKEYFSLLKRTDLFLYVEEAEIEELLICLDGKISSYDKGEFIYREGTLPVRAGLILEGSVHIIKEDFWGNRSILSEVGKAGMFGETYSCLGGESLGVSVEAAEDCKCLFLDFQKMLAMVEQGPVRQSQIVFNLIRILAGKNLFLTKKMEYISQRSTRQKLLAYLSEQSRSVGNPEFYIPFNRQQLADFLAVDRSAMSAELSKLRKEGVLDYRKNWFLLKE